MSAPPRAGEHAERFLPEEMSGTIVREHVGRYEFAATFVRGKVVLDAACGAGYGAPILRTAGVASYTGIDVSAAAVESATGRYGASDVRFLVGDATSLDAIADASIDVAISFETIEHVAEPEQLLRSMRRVLKADGTLLLSTPNREISNPSGDLTSAPPNPFHVREWRPREFVEMVGKEFEIQQQLGQAPMFIGKVLARRIARVRGFGWIEDVYRYANAGRAGQSEQRSQTEVAPGIPVSVTPRWARPTFVVCVCRKR